MLAFVIHTIGLGFRMYLEGRPPVTNLYSSAIFIGWGACLLGIILERIFKGGIGLVVAGFIGFITLIIAHHLALERRHDGNVARGAGHQFVAGHARGGRDHRLRLDVCGRVAGRDLHRARLLHPHARRRDWRRSLARMVYGIVCFATLFSFVGTILGGIWADQSWGRFWGWDPKENGALLIVLWNAIILHARWGGMIKERGLMAMAVFGNIVTSFSWFGVNMLGIGLHSYGFMDKAFPWLMAFDVSQVALIVLALLPLALLGQFQRNDRADTSRTALGSPANGDRVGNCHKDQRDLPQSCSLVWKVFFHKSYTQGVQAGFGDISCRTQEPWASWFLACRSALYGVRVWIIFQRILSRRWPRQRKAQAWLMPSRRFFW